MLKRPKYLNLFQIRLPLPALVSIMHRISGAVLFLALPFLLGWLQQSFASADGFAALKASLAQTQVKLVAIALLWAYFHHVCAGIRHLVIDAFHAPDLPAARRGALVALIGGIVAALIAGALLW